MLIEAADLQFIRGECTASQAIVETQKLLGITSSLKCAISSTGSTVS
jgi:hypothetical protein